MNIDEAHIHRRSTVLVRFSREKKFTLGDITLPVYAVGVNLHIAFVVLHSPRLVQQRAEIHFRGITLLVYAAGVNLHITFFVLDSPSVYNVILGRPWIHEMRVVLSTFHQVIRFSTE